MLLSKTGIIDPQEFLAEKNNNNNIPLKESDKFDIRSILAKYTSRKEEKSNSNTNRDMESTSNSSSKKNVFQVIDIR